MRNLRWPRIAPLLMFVLLSPSLAAQTSAEPAPTRSRTLEAGDMIWQQQTPNLPIMIGELWGDRRADGGFGELVRLPPGFASGLHAHSGDFHGVLIKGVWVHEGANGEGRDTRLMPGSYVRQAGGEMHIDRCVSEEPCVLFLYQYARADIIWPDEQQQRRANEMSK